MSNYVVKRYKGNSTQFTAAFGTASKVTISANGDASLAIKINDASLVDKVVNVTCGMYSVTFCCDAVPTTGYDGYYLIGYLYNMSSKPVEIAAGSIFIITMEEA